MTTHMKQAGTRRILIAAAEQSGVEDQAIDRLFNGTIGGLLPVTQTAEQRSEDGERWSGQD